MGDPSTAARVCLLVALLALAPIVASGAALAAGDVTQAGNVPESDNGEFTIDELSRDGPHHTNAPDSVRFGRERMYWLVYWPASAPTTDPGNDDNWEYLTGDHTVGRNSIWLRSIVQDRDAGRVTVHVVAWQKGQRTVTRGNTTTTETVAENVTHTTHKANLQRGWLLEEIPLKQHDKKTRITMWVEGVDGARWTFTHKSVATTQSIAINSWGDYLVHLAKDLLSVIAVGGFVVGMLTKRALERAGRGPGYGYFAWIAILTILGGITAGAAYKSLSEVIVAAPMLIGVAVVALFGIIMLETYTNNVSKALFLQPKLEHTTSPAGDDAHDIIGMEAESHTTVRMPDGGVAIVKTGLFAFLARVWGRAAYLENVGRLRTRIETSDSKWDDVYLVDPEADDVVDYTAESWTFDLPPLDRKHAPLYVSLASFAGIAALLVNNGVASPVVAFGAVGLGLAVWAATPIDGQAAVTPAPAHFRSAYGTIATQIEGYSNAETIEEAKQQLDKERIHKHQDVETEIEERDKSLVREMHDGDVPASIRNADDGHSDVVDNRAEDTNGDDVADDGGNNGN